MRRATDLAPMHTDCRLYRGSAPCEPHKLDGRLCPGCEAYDPIGERVLVIKLGAMGDVVRTAALLPDIAAAHDRPTITWITRPESLPILAAVPQVHRALGTADAVPVLQSRRFSAVYVLDADEEALALAGMAQATVRRGYRAGENGTAVGVEPGGDDTLFRLGLSDDAKRANRRSYLELLLATAGLRYSGRRPQLTLREDVVAAVRAELGPHPRPRIGIHAGASGRWQHKHWEEHHLNALLHRLGEERMSAVLFGDGEDAALHDVLARRFSPHVVSFASHDRVDRLFAGIAEVDALITTDTLAMHAGWSFARPIVALFGPTSAPEIDLDPLDVKLTADLPCLSCYKRTCSIERHCMELLTPDLVFDALRSRLEVAAR